MGAPKMSVSGKIIGHNLLDGMKLRNKQMRFILENLTEPDLSMMGSSTSIADSFGIDEDKDEEFNTQGITWRILNSQGFGNGDHDSNKEPSYMSVAFFMRDIQMYLPKSLRPKKNGYQLWKKGSFNATNTFAEETTELLDQMVEWLWRMKNTIEDLLASRYYVNGKPHHLEMLKRRYKNDWSEKIEQSVDSRISGAKSLKIDFGENEEDSSTD